MLNEFSNDMERAEALQNILISIATGGTADDGPYKLLRAYFIENSIHKEFLPDFVRTNRDLGQFWQYIKFKFPSYAERRNFIWSEFSSLLGYLEGKGSSPVDKNASRLLKEFNEENVHAVWQKALERRQTDPEGAITAARTLVETVCKHILDSKSITYNATNIELHELYRLTSKELNLAPSQHTEEIFKQILGGCSAIVNGLGTLRNKLGDAHGKGLNPVKPSSRHAELAVNIAGAMSLFFVSTWAARNET